MFWSSLLFILLGVWPDQPTEIPLRTAADGTPPSHPIPIMGSVVQKNNPPTLLEGRHHARHTPTPFSWGNKSHLPTRVNVFSIRVLEGRAHEVRARRAPKLCRVPAVEKPFDLVTWESKDHIGMFFRRTYSFRK